MRALLGFKTLLIACFASSNASADVCGQLAAVKGSSVAILRAQSRTGGEAVRFATKVGDGQVSPLECDDVVVIGRDSSAKIVLPETKVAIGPESRVEIAQVVKNESGVSNHVSLLNLTYGKLRAIVTHQKAGPQAKLKTQPFLRVKTYSAVVGVRGTDFFTSYEPNSGLTDQATLDGDVEVQTGDAAERVFVKAGQQVSVENASSTRAPLKVVPMQESMKQRVRVVSAVAKDDAEFARPAAVSILGQPETWTMERESLPERLKGIKNEF